MLVFFLSLTQQEPVVTVEGVDIVRLSISIPSQTIKMPNLDPSMVTVPNLGGTVPSLGNVPNLDIPSLDLSNLDLKNPSSLGKSLQDRLSNFGKEVSDLGKNVSQIGKNVTREVSKAGRNVSKEVSKDLSRIGDEIQRAIQNNFEGLQVDLNAQVNVTASVYNPNSFDGIFNFMNMGIYLFGIHVSNISLPAFELGKKQTKIATVPIVVKSFPLLSTSSSAQVRSPIAAAMRERKIKMQTFINAQGKVRVWGISSPTYNVTVMCVMTRPSTWDDVEAGQGNLVTATSEGERADVAGDANDVVNQKALSAEQAIFLCLSEIEEDDRRKARKRRVLLAGGAALILLALLIAAAVAVGVTASKKKCQESNNATSADAMLTQQQQQVGELVGTVQIGGRWGNVSTVVAKLDIQPNTNGVISAKGGGATSSWDAATWQPSRGAVEDTSAVQQLANPELTPVNGRVFGMGVESGATTDPYDYGAAESPPPPPASPTPSPPPPASPPPSPPAAPQTPSEAPAANSSSSGPLDILSRIAALIKPPDLSVQGVDFQNGHLTVSGPDSWSFSLEPFKEVSLDLTALINVAAVVSNPNPIEIIAQEVNMDVSFYSVDVGYADIPDFTLPANSSATITVPFNIDNFPLLSFSDQSLITGSIANGELEFQVVINLKARTRILQSLTPAFNVQLVCNAVVNPTQNNVLSKSCSTNIAT
ncbi:unnamed protein product [Closterium sp. Yama58-4]|nr:unnamed protein product [Closterium sp. Yama58-4]